LIRNIIIIIIVLLGIQLGCSNKNKELVRNSMIEIYIGDKSTRSTKLAARQLSYYINKIGLGDAQITTKPSFLKSKFKITILNKYSAPAHGIDTTGFVHGGFYIRSSSSEIILAGDDTDFVPIAPYGRSRAEMDKANLELDRLTHQKWENPYTVMFKSYSKNLDLWEQDGRGTINAAYQWLEEIGVRWYKPGELGEVLPEPKKVEIPQLNKYYLPEVAIRKMAFYGRRFFQASDDDILWELRLKLNPGNEIIGGALLGHGMIVLHSRPEIRNTKPLYFGLYNGVRDVSSRDTGKPCLSSAELKKDNIAYARFMFDHYREPTISVMPPDAYSVMCTCDLCRSKGTPDRGFEGSMSDYVWNYVNDVAKELYKSHPDRKIICFAYGSYLLPPATIKKLSPNIIVGICRTRVNLTSNDKITNNQKLIEDWSRLTTNKFVFWDYYLYHRDNNSLASFPVFFPHKIAYDIRKYNNISFGEFIEVFRNTPPSAGDLATNHINVYVTSKCYWNTKTDIDKLLEEYFMRFYKESFKEMQEFFNLAENNWTELKEKPEVIEKLFNNLNKAISKSKKDPTEYARIMEIYNLIEPLQTFMKIKKRPDTKNFNLRALTKNASDLKFDGKMDEKYWQDLYGYKFGTSSNQSVFKLSWITDTLVVGFNNISNIAEKNRTLLLDFETSDKSQYKIRIYDSGSIKVTDFKGNLLKLKPLVKVYTSGKSWGAEIKIPLSKDKNVIAQKNGFYGAGANATFPWYFNLTTSAGNIESKYFINPSEPKDISQNMVEMIIR